MTLLDQLITKFPRASRQTLRRMVQAGRVTVNGVRAASVKVELKAGDKLRVSDHARTRRNAVSDQRLPFAIVFEDDDVLVIDKPPGLLTATVEHEKRPTVLAAVTEHLARTQPNTRVGLIHRLDRDASGLLVLSKNPGAYNSLKEQFFRHTVDRIYHAVVDAVPKPAEGRIRSKLSEANDGTVSSSDHGQPALTEYRMLRQSKDGLRSLLRVKLHTGRKHQIRAHLSERGMPIVNDPVYAPIYAQRRRSGRMMLVATELAFDHPSTGKRMKFVVPLPGEMSAMVRN